MEYDKVFPDTNVLLNPNFDFNKYKEVHISIISLEELDGLKRNEEVGFQARQAIKKIKEANNRKIKFYGAYSDSIKFLEHKNDNELLSMAYDVYTCDNEVVFLTDDYNLFIKADEIKLPCSLFEYKKQIDTYTGWKIVNMTDKEYNVWINSDDKTNKWDLGINEYMLINSIDEGGIIDCLVYTSKGFRHITSKNIESIYFGKLKPKDEYQVCLIDSLLNNQMIMVRGTAGTGKSYISLLYAMSMIAKNKYNKLIVLVNNVPTKNAAYQGYYPGTKDEKLLEGQVGNMLASKFGDKSFLLQLINQNKLVLLPFSDIRGFDTTGMNAIIYISEAQNLDIELMKLAIQRVGEDCQLIIDGDNDIQVDKQVFEGNKNGMKRVSEIFRGQDFYGEIELKNIYRSTLAKVADLM